MSAAAEPRRAGGADARLKAELIATARAMNAAGINQGTSGNLSARRSDGRGVWITPSSLDYDVMEPGDLVALDWDGSWRCRRAARKPSSEWRFHRDVLAARPEMGALLHAHPIHATALACHGRGVPPFHYMVALFGGRDVRCAPYATFGSQELSDHALAALDDRSACLLAHHGALVGARGLGPALALAIELETLAAQYLAACALGEPPLLSDAEIDAVLAKIAAGAGYGASG